MLGGFLDMRTCDGLCSLISFLKSEHKDLNLLICMILWGFLDQMDSEPFLQVTPGCLQVEEEAFFYV